MRDNRWIVIALGMGAFACGVAGINLRANMQVAVPLWVLSLLLVLLGSYVSYTEISAAGHLAEVANRRTELFEREMRRQREVVDELADGLDVAIFLCNTRGVVEYANRKAVELFRLQNPVGKSIIASTLSAELESLIADASRDGQHRVAEIVFRYPDERVGMANAWQDPNAADRIFLSIYEITSLRRLERVRRDFVANVSHELRTPMTTIRAMSETLLDADPEEYDVLGHKYLNRIISEVDRLTSISDDLLTLTSAESNPVIKSSVNLVEMARSVVDQFLSQAKAKGLDLSFEAPEFLMVSANPNQFTQVIVNLLANAVNYTNQGSIQVRIFEEVGSAVLECTDTGIGIPEEDQPRIFERFYRVDKGRSRATGGTGLGLSIVKHIVESHGGTVKIDSKVGIGSTFIVRIPTE
ncbi:MAG: GHKL domain-containing protein [Armatimonadetes bacterium]|nr:GHKL domain-containing protein [Armatimonadota bacterium]